MQIHAYPVRLDDVACRPRLVLSGGIGSRSDQVPEEFTPLLVAVVEPEYTNPILVKAGTFNQHHSVRLLVDKVIGGLPNDPPKHFMIWQGQTFLPAPGL